MVDKDAILTLDDSTRKLTINAPDHPLDINYSQVDKVIFEVSRRMRGGYKSGLIPLVGGDIVTSTVDKFWCFIRYLDDKGQPQSYLLEIDRNHSDAVIARMTAAFGDNVIRLQQRVGDEIDPAKLKDIKSKQSVTVEKQDHPLPELKPDKALIVAVCPPLATRYAGKGIQFKLHANDHVIIIKKEGTYGFAYVDPGDYLLVSQSENANGLAMTLEAGKAYYFFQNIIAGEFKANSTLSQQSKERVMYEIEGSYYSEWRAK